MNHLRHIYAGLMVLQWIAACSAAGTTLKDAYARDFQVGATLAERYLEEPYSRNEKALRLLEREFSCVTSENLMKPASLRPAPGEFSFERSDQFVRLARRLDLDVVGHVLVWHAQTPEWFFEDDKGNPVTRDELTSRMKEHVQTVVRRYKGHVKYWDVVNEAVVIRREVDPDNPVNGDGSTNRISVASFRDSPWYSIIGEEYIALAFKFAHEADPGAGFIYNDYGMTDPVKVDFVVKNIIRPLKKKGIAIDAVGMQGHWHVDSPDLAEIGEAIDAFAAEKVKVHITELDLSVLPRAHGYHGADISQRYELQDELNPYRDGLPEEVARQQAERYRAIFDIFESRRRDVERVTFWGLCDGDSWKNNFPVRGRTDYPLLFGRDFEPKPAYDALIKN